MVDNSLSCPVPASNYKTVVMGHGSGGRMSLDLIKQVFLSRFANPYLDALNDQAVMEMAGGRLALTTDSYVVSPIFFPGGDIGRLAVNGTINDLAMGGAQPLFLSLACILEEGFPMADLERIATSVQQACAEAGVQLVTGDTKVVERGKADGVFLTTSGVGLVGPGVELGSRLVRPGDRVILSGAIGEHGITILSVREGLEFETHLESDTAPLHRLVAEMLAVGGRLHALRDPTRGGLASAVNEIAQASGTGIVLDEDTISVPGAVAAACELLGLDPLYVANEGKLVAFVAPEDAERILAAMRRRPEGREAAIIGRVVDEHPGLVVMRTRLGSTRVVDLLPGDQLPRIC